MNYDQIQNMSEDELRDAANSSLKTAEEIMDASLGIRRKNDQKIIGSDDDKVNKNNDFKVSVSTVSADNVDLKRSRGIISYYKINESFYDLLLKNWREADLPSEILPANSPEKTLRLVMESLSKKAKQFVARPRGNFVSNSIINDECSRWFVLVDDILSDLLVPIFYVSLVRLDQSLLKHLLSNNPKLLETQILRDKRLHFDFCPNLNEQQLVLAEILREKITQEYIKQIELVSNEDMVELILSLATTHAHAVKITNNVFFIPDDFVPSWRSFTKILTTNNSCTFYEIPIHASKSGDVMISDLVVAQTASAADIAIQNINLLDKESGKTDDWEGKRSTETAKKNLVARTVKLSEIEEQLGIYENIFDDDKLKENIITLRAKLSTALFAAQDEDK